MWLEIYWSNETIDYNQIQGAYITYKQQPYNTIIRRKPHEKQIIGRAKNSTLTTQKVSRIKENLSIIYGRFCYSRIGRKSL
jgi:hypothetical protein